MPVPDGYLRIRPVDDYTQLNGSGGFALVTLNKVIDITGSGVIKELNLEVRRNVADVQVNDYIYAEIDGTGIRSYVFENMIHTGIPRLQDIYDLIAFRKLEYAFISMLREIEFYRSLKLYYFKNDAGAMSYDYWGLIGDF